MDSTDRFLVGIGSLSVTIFVLSAVLTGSVQMYRAFFYNYFSPATSVAMVAAIISGILLIIRGVGGPRSRVIRGAALLAATYAVIYTLPRFAGFSFWAPIKADSLIHYSDIDYILSTGSIPGEVLYPFVHIYASTLSLVSGAEVEGFQAIIGLNVTAIFIFGIGLLARNLFHSQSAGVAFGAVACLLVYGKFQHNLMPWFFAFSLIPTALYLLNQVTASSREAWRVMLMIVAAAGVLFHPMTALVFILMFVVTGYVDLSGRLYSPHIEAGLSWLWISILLAAHVIYISWYFSFERLQYRIYYITSSIYLGRRGDDAQYAAQAGETTYTLLQLIRQYLVEIWIAGIAIIGLGAAALLVLWNWRRKGKFTELPAHRQNLNLFTVFYVAGLGLALFLIVFDVIASGPIRTNQVTIFASILLVGMVVWIAFDRQHQVQYGAAFRAIVIVCLLFVAVAAPFIIYYESKHLHESEMAGDEWHYQSHNAEIETLSQYSSSKQVNYISPEAQVSLTESPYRSDPELILPPNLGYGSNETIAETTDSQAYIVLNKRGTRWWYDEPSNRWSTIPLYTEADVERIQKDYTASEVYDNGEYWVYLTSEPENGSD